MRFFSKIGARHRVSVHEKKNRMRQHTIFHSYCRHYGRYYYRMTPSMPACLDIVRKSRSHDADIELIDFAKMEFLGCKILVFLWF